MNCPKCGTDNSGDSRFCKACATPLPVPGADRQGFPTQTLQTSVTEIATGTTLAGRYQVIEELGHGGMGRVYKVFDTDIKEKIALKLLRPEIALDKETVERFSNELKLARKISHRNVCRMFDLGKAESTTFITMEFVPGEDLKKLIRKTGQLGAGRAVSIAKQVCEGLEEAHHLGVVHRDLKPQNIMVDEDGNVRIMDFGIARSLRGKGITGAGVMIGTPEYMSPEQVEGKEVDQRSDVYSLGIILYEMVTGHVPFEGDTAFTIGVKHKSERPRNPRELNTQIPEDLSRVILKCLEKDKGRRYQTAEELREELERVEQGLPTTERTAPKRKSTTSREITVTFSARKLVIPAIAILVLAVIGFVLWRVIPSRKSAPSSSASGLPTLAVLYFENKSGDPKLDNWRDGLAELIITSLQQSKYIRVISSDEIYTILKRLGLAEARKYSSEDIEKIAAQTRATHILRGSYIKAGESFVITAGLQKAGRGESPSALRLEARDDKDIIAKVDELTRQVKEGLNLTAAQISGDIEKEAGKITTSSPEALKYYTEGRRLHNENNNDQAIAHMEKAVEIDPEFAMAYRSMAMSYSNSGHPVEARKYMNKAMELSTRLPENERLFIETNVLYLDEDYAREIELLERLAKTYPGSSNIAHASLVVAYGSAGNLDKAIEHGEFVIQSWRNALNVGDLAQYYMGKGLYQKAEDVCRSFLKDVEDNASVHFLLGCTYLCQRQFDLAAAEVDKAYLLDPQLKYFKGWILLLKDDFAGAEKILGADYQGLLLLAQGKIQETLALAQGNLEKSRGDKEKERDAYGGLVDALSEAGRYEDAYRAFDQYLKLSAEYRKSMGESALPYLPSQQKNDLSGKGWLQAEMKSFDEAKKTAEELRSLIDKGINTKELRWYEHILGQIELGKKNFRQAVDLFSTACGRLNFDNIGCVDAYEHAFHFDALARALYESGELDKARQEYEKITQLTIGRIFAVHIYARAFYMLGKIAEQQGDKARARQNYRKFLDLWKDADPGLPEVPDAKARLAALGA
jgi:serine/threonine protein kinase/tetratricopeptide (TPR) repeat protein